MSKKIFLIFGTRPEAIKMAPVALELAKSPSIEVKIVLTAQHRQMLDQVMNFFGLVADFDLDVMKNNQTLFDITTNVIQGLGKILSSEKPDLVMVHGDTSTTFAASLSAYYLKIPVAHVEAGLRTGDIYSPFPEEMNRKLTGAIASYNFAPTERAKENLLNENADERGILVTGNTVIDALLLGREKVKNTGYVSKISSIFDKLSNKKIILVTGHRRENFGRGFINICEALRTLAESHKDAHIVYPVHLNPNVQGPVYDILANVDNISLIEPLDYPSFIYAMDKCYFIITDSGGVQEEAPSLGKPVLVMRDTTERPEGVEAGTVKIVGTDKQKIIEECEALINDELYYHQFSQATNPYGDGKASERIRYFLEK